LQDKDSRLDLWLKMHGEQEDYLAADLRAYLAKLGRDAASQVRAGATVKQLEAWLTVARVDDALKAAAAPGLLRAGLAGAAAEWLNAHKHFYQLLLTKNSEACRVPAGQPEGGQFSSCDDEGGGATGGTDQEVYGKTWVNEVGKHFPGVETPVFHATNGGAAIKIIDDGLRAGEASSFGVGNQGSISMTSNLDWATTGARGNYIFLMDEKSLAAHGDIISHQDPTAENEYERRFQGGEIKPSEIKGLIINRHLGRSELSEPAEWPFPVVYKDRDKGWTKIEHKPAKSTKADKPKKERDEALQAYLDKLAVRPPDDVVQAMQDWTDDLLDEPYWKDVSDSTREDIVEELKTGVDEGKSTDEIADEIEEKLGPDGGGAARAQLIARSECTGALNAGHQESRNKLDEMGLLKAKEWLSILDQDVRPAHEDANEQQVDNDEPFILVNDDGEEEECQYPGDTSLSAAMRCNCRCNSSSVLVSEDELFAGLEDGKSYAFRRPADRQSALLLDLVREACRVPAGEPEGGRYVACGASGTVGNTSASPEHHAAVAQAWDALPGTLRDRLTSHGVQVTAAGRGDQVDNRGDISADRAAQANGLYSFSTKVLAVMSSTVRQGVERPNEHPAATLAHEAGHALDDALGRPSQSAEFRVAHDADVRALGERKWGVLYFARQTGEGRMEAFAQAAGELVGQAAAVKPDFAATFPKTREYVAGLLGKEKLL